MNIFKRIFLTAAGICASAGAAQGTAGGVLCARNLEDAEYQFNSRGIGLDRTPGDFVLGGPVGMYNNISGFVKGREAGEAVVRLFGGKGARLDYREREPDWVQVKIGALDGQLPHLRYLDFLIRANDMRINLRMIEAARLLASPGERPARRGLEVEGPEIKRIQALARADNRSWVAVAYSDLTRGIKPEAALAVSERIRKQIVRAGEFTRKNDYDRATGELLRVDFGALPIQFDFFPLPSFDRRQFGSSEREFNYRLEYFSPRAAAVTADGRIIIPAAVKLNGAKSSRHIWAARYWIRVAAEELTHVASLLHEHGTGRRGVFSELLTSDSLLRSEIEMEGDLLNQRELRERDVKARMVAWLEEADAYAFLIEALGGNIMPSWIGRNSGYTLRALVDRALVQRGFIRAPWTKERPTPGFEPPA